VTAPVVLAIDPGRSTGWAVVQGQNVLAFGCLGHKAKAATASDYFDRAYKLILAHSPALVAYEAMIVVDQSGFMATARARVPIEMAAETLAVPWRAVFPASWRSFFRLGRKQDKPASLRMASSLARAHVESDDAAEAILLGIYAAASLFAPDGSPAPERPRLRKPRGGKKAAPVSP